MRRNLLAFVLAVPLLGTVACGADDDSCGATRNVPLSLTVDGRSVSTCGGLGWELRVRTCGGCASCGACDGDSAIDRACAWFDACHQASVDLPPGDSRVCVEAILPNGSLQFEDCADVSIGDDAPAPITLAIDTEDAFPCIRSWVYDGSVCCNDVVGACNPP